MDSTSFAEFILERAHCTAGFHLLDVSAASQNPSCSQTVLEALFSYWQQRPAHLGLQFRYITLFESGEAWHDWLKGLPQALQTCLTAQSWGLDFQSWHTLHVALPQWDSASKTCSSFCILLALADRSSWPQLLGQLQPQVDGAIVKSSVALELPLAKAVVKTLRQLNAKQAPTVVAWADSPSDATPLEPWRTLGLVQKSSHPIQALTYLQPQPWLASQLTRTHRLPAPRLHTKETPAPKRHVHIIGAGLAGSSCAWMLAQHGVNVTVWDKAPHIASGASSMPAGLFEVTPSKDHNLLTQITSHGVRLLLSVLNQLAPQLEKGVHWCDSGITLLAHRPRHAHQATDDTNTVALPAGWIQPAALVAALLNHPRIQLRLTAQVPTQNAIHWLRDQGETQDETVTDVIYATGFEAPSSLIHPVAGQVLWAPHNEASKAADWPDRPVNGAAYVIPHVPNPLGGGTFWLTGATFDHADLSGVPNWKAHAQNWQKLQAMLPKVAQLIDMAALQDLNHHARTGIRGTTRDRLPLVGRLSKQRLAEVQDIDQWICAGLGSRGISIALWCAQLLTAQMLKQPLLASSIWLERLNPHR